MDTSLRAGGLRAAVAPARRIALERLESSPAWVLLTELFIGLGWLRAVAEKLIDPGWWRGDVIDGFVADHVDLTLAWYAPFLDTLVLPLVQIVAVAVVLGQLVAGISLLAGRRRTLGLATGMLLNLNFMAVGAVAPSAFYLLAQGAVALWLCERAARRATVAALRIASAVAAFVVGLNLPFISTLHPAGVIDDPAVMFTFGGALAALTCVLAADAAASLANRPRARIEASSPVR